MGTAEQLAGRAKTKAETDADSKSRSLALYDPLKRYLADVGKYDLLTREEEWELAVRLKEDGDGEAAYRLVVCNLRLVVKIAMSYHRVWMKNVLDLIQEGNVGLIHAVNKYDPYRGVKFSYYASFWIKAYIMKFIMDNWRLVKLGTTQAQRKLFFRLKSEKAQLALKGFDPEPKLISRNLNVSEKTVVEMDQRLKGHDLSLNTYLNDSSDTERINIIPADDSSPEEITSVREMKQLLLDKLNEFRKTITLREQHILDNRLLNTQPMTLKEIGEQHGICRERVRQVESRIIEKLKYYFRAELPDYDLIAGVS